MVRTKREVLNVQEDRDVQEIIQSNGPKSEFQKHLWPKCLYIFIIAYRKKWQWKYFATSHGKGAVDGVDGRGKDSVIALLPVDFYEAAKMLLETTTVYSITLIRR